MEIVWGQVAISSVLGGFVGGLMAHWLAQKRDRAKERIAAFEDFGATIAPLLSDLAARHANHVGGRSFVNVNELLAEQFVALRTAMLKLRLRVSAEDRQRLDEQWDEFVCLDATTQQPTMKGYAHTSDDHHEQLAKRDLAAKRLTGMARPS